MSSVLEAPQHQEPRGATGNARGEPLAGSSVASGGLGIHEDHPREPEPELHVSTPTGAPDECPVAGCPSAGDIGFPPWEISPTPRAVGGAPALPKGAPPTLNYLPRIPAPPAALEFVVTISGTRCLSLSGRPRTNAGPSTDGPSFLAVRWPGPPLGWVGWRKAEAGGKCV